MLNYLGDSRKQEVNITDGFIESSMNKLSF